MKKIEKIISSRILIYSTIGFFFALYLILSSVKHYNFLSGYDLAIIDQVIWKYSQFKTPLTTIHAIHSQPLLADHVEFIYILLSPTYWLFNSAYTIIFLQTFTICISGLAVYKLAIFKKLKPVVAFALLISYLSFYGIQQAIWSDVHSLVFAAGFLAWFIYFLEKEKVYLSFLFFALALICKEDIALLTLLVSIVQLVIKKNKLSLLFIFLSILYLFFVFFIHFPYFTQDGYRYQNPNGFFADTNPLYLMDTTEKREVFLYSFVWFGFLPILSPLHLLPAIGDISHYFIFGKNLVAGAQSIFLHYRVTLGILLVWPTIYTISRFKKLNTIYIALYLLACATFFQYYLHLPLSYLTKSWFWQPTAGSREIRTVIESLKPSYSLATQNNITPHLAHREYIYTLFPEKKTFMTDSPCNQTSCNWFRWGGSPEYILVDTSSSWDARHFLTSREDFIDGIANLETKKIIKKEKQINNTTLYKVIGKP